MSKLMLHQQELVTFLKWFKVLNHFFEIFLKIKPQSNLKLNFCFNLYVFFIIS